MSDVKTMREMKIVKTCACGIVHLYIPVDAKFQKPSDPDDIFGGWFWNCACRSTLFVPLFKLKAA